MRSVLAALIRWSGAGWLLRNTYARRRVGIILYHDPDPATLSRQLGYLCRRYELIELDRLVGALRSGDWSDVPPKSIVITIDDGRAGNFALLDVFRDHGVTPTIYLCTQIVGTDRHFWFLEVDSTTAEELKLVSSAERATRLEELTGFTPTRDYGPESRQALSRAELTQMAGDCDFQSHTRFHPILTGCSPDEAREEIADSRTELTGSPVEAPFRHFAFPNGCYSERDVELVRNAGYESARTVDIGWNHPRTDPYRLRILSVADDFSNTMLGADLAGLKWLSRLLRKEGGIDGRFRLKGRQVS